MAAVAGTQGQRLALALGMDHGEFDGLRALALAELAQREGPRAASARGSVQMTKLHSAVGGFGGLARSRLGSR